jgi:TnpA family transposase
MSDPAKRLKILTKSEIQQLYDLPNFTYKEKDIYFSLNPLEEKEVQLLRTFPSKIYFILQLGYFKSKKIFFVFEFHEVQEDTQYIVERYFPDVQELPNIKMPRSSRIVQQERILKLLNYQNCNQERKNILQEKANYLTTIYSRPVYIFRELLNYLEHQRITIPGYTTMQDIVGKAIIHEKNRLKAAVQQEINKDSQEALDKLLTAEDSLYELTFLKREPRDFSYKEITMEVSKGESLKELYHLARDFLPRLEISNENIKYYAYLVGYYTVYKLKRMKREIVYVYLLCFVLNRYQKINDNLVNTFIYYVSNYINEAKKVAKEKVYEYKMEGNKHSKDAGKILDLFIDKNISGKVEFEQVREIAFSILAEEKFPLMSKYISKTKFDDSEYEWNHYIELAQKFKVNLRYIFLNLDFEGQTTKDTLLKAVLFLKEAFQKNKSLAQFPVNELPQEFIPSKLRKYLYEIRTVEVNGKTIKYRKLNVDKYEFLIYRLLKVRLESGEIFIKESLNFKSFEEDLIDDEKWKNKEQLIQSLDLPSLKGPVDKLLFSFKEELESKLKIVNNRIKNGENTHIKITEKGEEIKWSLPYKKSEEQVNNPIYGEFRQIGINDLLHFVDEHSEFMDSFTHILDRYVKTEADTHRISACIVACGTNIGISKMADISDMSFNELVSTLNNFIRLETLKTANDKISNAMAVLPIFKYYNIKKETIHSSSDGQKYETQFDTINSRYSPKYFGLNKGISSYTLVANHIPVNAKIIGANEHESHYVFDLLYNNTSEIVPDIHSTDTHGSNNVNSIILYFFGHIFAPRYKKISSKAKMIYSFENPSKYEGFLLKPIRKINTKLIEEEWENIQRIIVSLALKTTTQSTIIRKLSSYARKNKTKRALWELDNIVHSIYILDYIDSLELRQNIQKALNRGEAYHKLKRAVFHDNLGKFRVKTELEQQIWSECTRLICNSIIFYNAFILSRLLEQREKKKIYEEADVIKKISPVAWRHINLYGRYEFYRNNVLIDIDEIIDSMEKESLWNQISKS